MDNDERCALIDALEKLNKENRLLYMSKEYQLGAKIVRFIDRLKKFKIKKILMSFHNSIKAKNVKRTSIGMNCFDNTRDIDGYSVDNGINYRVAVYTCVVGGYEDIIEPYYCTPYMDYYVISDSKKSFNKWKKMGIPMRLKNIKSSAQINRYIKMHPKELFPGYDFTIYLDGKIIPVSDLSCLINTINPKTGLSFHRHSYRNDLYDEAQICKILGKGKKCGINKQIEKYKNENFPHGFGLLEAAVIVTDLKNSIAVSLLDRWWKDYLENDSGRDQLSLPYVLWKNGYTLNDIGDIGMKIEEDYKFKISYEHQYK